LALRDRRLCRHSLHRRDLVRRRLGARSPRRRPPAGSRTLAAAMSSETETSGLRPQLPLPVLLHRLMWSRAWDWVLRLAAVLFHGVLMLKQSIGLIRLFAARDDHSPLFFATAVAARFAVIMFLTLIVFVIIVRLRPVAKSSGIVPRLFALAGTCMPSFMTLL